MPFFSELLAALFMATGSPPVPLSPEILSASYSDPVLNTFHNYGRVGSAVSNLGILTNRLSNQSFQPGLKEIWHGIILFKSPEAGTCLLFYSLLVPVHRFDLFSPGALMFIRQHGSSPPYLMAGLCPVSSSSPLQVFILTPSLTVFLGTLVGPVGFCSQKAASWHCHLAVF